MHKEIHWALEHETDVSPFLVGLQSSGEMATTQANKSNNNASYYCHRVMEERYHKPADRVNKQLFHSPTLPDLVTFYAGISFAPIEK